MNNRINIALSDDISWDKVQELCSLVEDTFLDVIEPEDYIILAYQDEDE